MGAKPWVFHDDGGLVVGNARTVKEEGEDKIVTWHKDNAAAAQNYGDADYMYPGNHDLPLAGGNYVVNVSGWTMNVTGTGNVTFYDSANADFTTYGTVTVNGPTVSNTFATVGPDGYTYYMVKEGDTYSFHRVSVKVNGVSIRPSVAGIYYTSVWQCDAKLAEKIQSFGVAVSLKDQPTDGFRNDGDTLFTKFLKDEFESGKTMTSVLISNILAEDKDNADRATKSIYATAYIILDDGTEAGTVAVDGNDVNFSLKQAMERIDNNPKVYLNSKTQVDNFYNTWKTVMESWNFQNIGKYTTDPAEDDSLNVLMIGNSFCYYYVQELYDLMEQDGIQANVYNLYKSGCTLEEHYNWWNSNHNGYQFFWKTNADGYNLVNSDKTYVTMADSLMAENWDVISIQESLFKNIQAADRDAYIAQAKVYMDTLIPMLQKAFPNAKIYWHQQWCPEVGFTQGQNSIADAAAQANYAQKEAALAAFAQETYGVKIVNTGDAWVNFRANEEYAALLPDGGLCARNGEDGFAGTNGGDGYHDGDIGGGQFLNACVWYETLIEDGDCTTKDFRADKLGYTLSAELVKALQNTAHATVNK